MPVSPLWKRKPTSNRSHARANSTTRRMPPNSFTLETIVSGVPSAIALRRSVRCDENEARVAGRSAAISSCVSTGSS